MFSTQSIASSPNGLENVNKGCDFEDRNEVRSIILDFAISYDDFGEHLI